MMKKEIKLKLEELKGIPRGVFLIIFFVVLAVLLLLFGFYILSGDGSGEEKESSEEDKEEQRSVLEKEEEVPSVQLEASGAYSLYYDKENETVLYEKRPEESFPIASISKLMTALVVRENYDLDEEVGVRESEIISRTEFRDFRAWSETSIEEMLYQMLIESNNSGAFALGFISRRYLDKDKEDPIDLFVKKMNKKAEELDLESTEFINPSGLDGKERYNRSTPKEVAELAKYILEDHNELFEISVIPSYRMQSPDGMIHYPVLNTNDFLHERDEEWKEDIVGGKTGWTRAAYGCLVIVLEAPNEEGYIINVVLGAPDRFEEMEKLVEYVQNKYQFQ